MNQVVIVGSGLGLTGCQLIQLHEANILLTKSGLELIDGIKIFQRISRETVESLEDLKNAPTAFESHPLAIGQVDPIAYLTQEYFHTKEKKS